MGHLATGSIEHLSTRFNSPQLGLEGVTAITHFVPDDGVDETKFYVTSLGGNLTVLDILDPIVSPTPNFLNPVQQVDGSDIPEFVNLADLQIGVENGNLWLVVSDRGSHSLTVFAIDRDTGLLTHADTLVDPDALGGVTQIATVNVGGEMFIVGFENFGESIATFAVAEDGTLTRTDNEGAATLPLWGVNDISGIEGGDSSMVVTVAGFEGIGLWEVDSAGQILLQDSHIVAGLNSLTTVHAANFSRGIFQKNFVVAGSNSQGKVAVLEIVGDEFVERSTFDLKAAGFFGNVTGVNSFLIDGIRLVTVATGVGEVLIMGLAEDGTLNLAQTWEWTDHPDVPIRNAMDVALVGIDGQCFLTIGGTPSITEPNLNGVSLFSLGSGNDVLAGTGADDDLLGFGRNDTLSGAGGSDRLYGGKGQDSVSGGGSGDTLGGGLGDDWVDGGAGNDLILGDDGNDTILGGDGNDYIGGGAGADSIAGGMGANTVSYHSSSGKVIVDLSAGTASGGHANGDTLTAIRHVEGGNGGDELTGDVLGNKLTGYSGDDQLVGNAGNDTLYGGEGEDDLFGGDDNDELHAGGATGSSVETLAGNAGDDLLHATEGYLNSFGGDGNDTIFIGVGRQQADGGAGADLFVLTESVKTGIDRILGFELGIDHVDVSALADAGIGTFAELQAAMRDTALGARLQIGDSRYIRFDSLLESQLTEDHFTF